MYKQVGSLSRGLKIARLCERNVSGRVTLLGLNSGRSVLIKVNKTRKQFSRNIHGARMFPQCSPVSHTGNIVSISKWKLCLLYTAGNFNENSSMRALANIFRARASEHSSNFCEQFQQGSNFASTFKLDGTIRYPSFKSE